MPILAISPHPQLVVRNQQRERRAGRNSVGSPSTAIAFSSCAATILSSNSRDGPSTLPAHPHFFPPLSTLYCSRKNSSAPLLKISIDVFSSLYFFLSEVSLCSTGLLCWSLSKHQQSEEGRDKQGKV